MERSASRISGDVDEVDGVISVTGQRVHGFAPRHKAVQHAQFFTLKNDSSQIKYHGTLYTKFGI